MCKYKKIFAHSLFVNLPSCRTGYLHKESRKYLQVFASYFNSDPVSEKGHLVKPLLFHFHGHRHFISGNKFIALLYYFYIDLQLLKGPN